FSKQKRLISRSHIDFKGSLHIPLPLHIALVLKLFSGNILTKDTNLTIPEMYQIGGSKSIRGYLEKEFSFTNVIYGQSECHFYFRQTSSLYLFCDAGFGGRWYPLNDIQRTEMVEKMVGYGTGVRVPTAIGTLSLELARNIFDSKNTLGRVHIRFQSPFSSEIDNIFSNR
ncbi:MAG: BamA/TamA family outer membrane protein, partial [Chitinispirillaceae bacterium]|nr:BamA/TamA family outer membrane protein [Chitinispirillaceae bacterium]